MIREWSRKKTQTEKKGWRKVGVSMYVKVLHSPIINFYWNFYSKELLHLYFTNAIKRDSVKTSLRDIFQAYLWCLRRFCEGIIKGFEAPI